MANQPKIITLFGFVLILISFTFGSGYTKTFISSLRADYVNDNWLVNNHKNDVYVVEPSEALIKIKNVYIDNNQNVINNSLITQELKSIPAPVVIEN